MNINDLTLGQIKEIKALLNSNSSSDASLEKQPQPFEEGRNYLIRTVTMIYVGQCVKCHDNRVVLRNCSWIPETKRWSETLSTGTFNEVEPYGNVDVDVWFGGILDHCEFKFALPTTAQ